MPVVSIFFGIIIKMYWNEHPPAHFHAYYAEHKASYAIEDLTCITGFMPKTAERLILEWASEHQAELKENWLRCTQKKSLSRIKPLK